jgi:hypothetical protein
MWLGSGCDTAAFRRLTGCTDDIQRLIVWADSLGKGMLSTGLEVPGTAIVSVEDILGLGINLVVLILVVGGWRWKGLKGDAVVSIRVLGSGKLPGSRAMYNSNAISIGSTIV